MKLWSPVVVSWAGFQPRTAGLAAELEGQACFIHSHRLARHPALIVIRYLWDSVRTWRRLSRLNPQQVIVVSPPLPAVLVAGAWSRLHGRCLSVDCHTGAYVGKKWGWTLPLHRWIFRRAAVVTHNTAEETALAEGWGAAALHVPDDLPGAGDADPTDRSARRTVLVAGSFDDSEPVAAVLAAAGRLPDVEVRLTGDIRRLTAAIRTGAPPNVVFTGYLPYRKFLGELMAADVVAVFSADEGEITYRLNRASCEAIGLERPLVLLDTPGNRTHFGSAALLCAAGPEAIADALQRGLESTTVLSRRSSRLRRRLSDERRRAVERLKAALLAAPAARAARRSVLVVTEHTYPFHPIIRRNVDELLAQGAEIDLVCMASTNVPSWKADHPGLRVHHIRLDHRRSPALRYLFEYVVFFMAALPIVCALSLRRRFTVVQVDNLPDFLVFVALPARLRGARVVMFFHELTPELLATRLRLGGEHPLIGLAAWLERRAIAFAHHVTVPSAACARKLIGRGVAPDKISVVPNLVAGAEAHALATRHADPPTLITHGSLIERYGVQVAIRAMAELRRDWHGLTLRVLGDGEYKPELIRLAAELGVSDDVIFRNFVPWPEAMAEVSAATIGLVPVITDGYGELLLPTKLFDYVTLGTPAVSACLPTIAEHFPPDAVSYFTPGDHRSLAERIDHLLRHPDEARRQAERAKEIACPASVSRSYLAALGLAPAAQPA